MRAGCGTGKTVAAYLWAARQAAGRKLFFCYPTTGTATEGFIGYVPPDEIEAALIHSRAEADLEDILGNGDDAPAQRARDLAALSAWQAPVAVCTADTVLGLIQNGRRSLFSFPSLANGAFVFDEIHQYDDRLFAALLRFLAAFQGAPVLLMTASLQEQRRQALARTIAAAGEQLTEIEGPRALEAIPRYCLRESNAELARHEAERVLTLGGKVLWVTNTVDRCVETAMAAKDTGVPVHIYHSRYRYQDRLAHHRAVIRAFESEGAALAITTQVCEVSLDLSADLLVTELAPVPALIQRLGRLNRRVTEACPGEPKPALIIRPEHAAPYHSGELALAERWLAALGSAAVSQADLARAFLALDSEQPVKPVLSTWLDGGPFAAQAPLREDGHTIEILLPVDAARCRDPNGRPLAAEITRCSVPMLFRPVMHEADRWPRLGIAFVAPAERVAYSEEWGARWQ